MHFLSFDVASVEIQFLAQIQTVLASSSEIQSRIVGGNVAHGSCLREVIPVVGAEIPGSH